MCAVTTYILVDEEDFASKPFLVHRTCRLIAKSHQHSKLCLCFIVAQMMANQISIHLKLNFFFLFIQGVGFILPPNYSSDDNFLGLVERKNVIFTAGFNREKIVFYLWRSCSHKIRRIHISAEKRSLSLRFWHDHVAKFCGCDVSNQRALRTKHEDKWHFS